MTRDELNAKMIALAASPAKPPFDAGAMGDALLDEIAQHWDDLPESTKAIALGVATTLKKHFAGDLVFDIRADMAVARAHGVAPPITPVDHEFTVEVTHLVDEGGWWMVECDALHLVTEAPTYDAVVARALEVAGELAIENGVMQRHETMCLSFVQRQSSLSPV